MTDLTEFQAALAAHTAEGIAFDPGKTGQFAALPEGYSIAPLEVFQANPNRHRTNHRFVRVDSLAAYIDRFGDETTMITADYGNALILAVIDGDLPVLPSHKEHKARFEAILSDKARAWIDVCGKPMTQVVFGLFLEDRAVDVVTPKAADVMDMVMAFDATKKVTFKSSTRLQDGSRQFQYVEEVENKRGGVTLPDHFMVFAPVYNGMEPQQIKFMVRYRIEDGALRFVVSMHDKEEVLRQAFDRCVDALRLHLKLDLPIYVVG